MINNPDPDPVKQTLENGPTWFCHAAFDGCRILLSPLGNLLLHLLYLGRVEPP